MAPEMLMNGITAQAATTTKARRRRNFNVVGLLLRLAIALILGLLIVMAFFTTGVISH
ncbi:hypothetical protein [Ktedonosporobacter rubrisoli]|uniref:hypothetical protein n=1 Tax=Ktedonosporobacter rubrisoli TaxID=2509675 RepID=UPI0013EEE51F|nr:hypothetical protein [Ktedonosporobacter rubrisoli]